MGTRLRQEKKRRGLSAPFSRAVLPDPCYGRRGREGLGGGLDRPPPLLFPRASLPLFPRLPSGRALGSERAGGLSRARAGGLSRARSRFPLGIARPFPRSRVSPRNSRRSDGGRAGRAAGAFHPEGRVGRAVLNSRFLPQSIGRDVTVPRGRTGVTL
jgi:hypothetical protein